MTIKPKLLLVDDDPDIHNFIQHELSGSAFDLFSAYNAQEAIDLLGDHHFAMGLIDIVLGTTETSEKLIQFFKEDLAGKNQHLPMAIMSAHMDEAYGKKIRLKGPTVFAALKKPLRPKQVLKLLTGSSKPSVLIINSELESLKGLKNEFEKSDFQLFTSLKLDQAQELLESTQFIAIVVENQLASDSEFEGFIAKNKERFNLPYLVTGVDANSSLIGNKDLMIFDFIEEPLSDSALLNALEKVKRWQESDEEDELLISNVTENLDEEIFQVKGLEESLSDETHISGSGQEKESVQVVGGNPEEAEAVQVVSGEFKDLAEENILIEGSAEEEDKTVTKLKGKKEDIGEEFWSVKNIGHENLDTDEAEFDPNRRNNQGVTPLMATCYLGELEQVQSLIEGGGDPRLKAKNGKTLVHFAAFSGNPDLVEYLVKEQGLKTNDRDLEKREPMFDAIKGDNADVVQKLIDLGARYTLKMDGKSYLGLATQRGSTLIMEKFMALGLSPEEKDYDGKSCLDYVQKMGRRDLADTIKKYLK
jgi:DNA-binding response OmpR family regulator